jgi:crossover junction endodeoxyribonuclease RuvC
MRVIGLDPGLLCTGWGIVDGGKRAIQIVNSGVISTSPNIDFPERLMRINMELEKIIERHKPEAAAVEEVFYAQNVKSALKLGQARGVLIVCAKRLGLEVHEYSTLEAKKAVTGFGQAEKGQVQNMVKIILSLKSMLGPDESDALALAICHINSLRVCA